MGLIKNKIYCSVRFVLISGILAGLFLSLSACVSDLKNLDDSYEKLSRQYESELKSDPENLELRIKLAQFYYKFRDYQKVKELLTAVTAPRARSILAKSLAKLKDYDYAIEVFKDLKDKTSDPEYLYLYGEVLENKNLFSQAVKIYSEVQGKFKPLAQERIRLIRLQSEKITPPQIMELYNQAKEFLKKVSDEAAVVFLVDENTEVTEENTSVTTMHVIEQILKDRGKNLAEIEIGYDSTYERVELEFARTITDAGNVLYAGKENIRDVSRYLNFPLYSNAKAFIVSMPMAEVGAFIEYKIKIYSSKLVDDDDFMFLYRLREDYPIFKANYKLIVPEDREVNFKFFNEANAIGYDLSASFEKQQGKKIYVWNFSQIEPLIPEYNMPPASYVNPAVLISSFSSWNEIYRWWRSLYQNKFALDRETLNFVSELINGSDSDFEKARKIYEFCAQDIRYVAVEYGESGYEPHSAQEVFVNRYGDCKDQAILITAMMRAVGLKAYPVLIPTRAVYPMSEDFPSINFNHVIAAVELDGSLVFVDPTAETTSFLDLPLSDQDRLTMVFLDNNWKFVTTPSLENNEIIYTMEVTLNQEESADIERTVTTRGFFSSAYRAYLRYTHPSKIKEDIQRKTVEISSFSRLINYDIENADSLDKEPVLKYKFNTKKFLNPAGNLRVIPALNELHISHDIIGKEERDFPVDFEGVHHERANIRIILPDTLKVKYQPEYVSLENKWFQFFSSYEVLPKMINFIQEFSLKVRFVPPQEYGEFKKELERVLYLLREEIILESSNTNAGREE